MSPRIKRKPGAQPGNQNARKHGFYSNALTPEQTVLLAPARRLGGVEEELALARVKLNSIVANDPGNMNLLIDAIAVVSRLTGQRQKYGKCQPRKFARALEIVLRDCTSLAREPARRSQPEGGVVPPSSPANNSCVI